jgi:hypothetical protein
MAEIDRRPAVEPDRAVLVGGDDGSAVPADRERGHRRLTLLVPAHEPVGREVPDRDRSGCLGSGESQRRVGERRGDGGAPLSQDGRLRVGEGHELEVAGGGERQAGRAGHRERLTRPLAPGLVVVADPHDARPVARADDEPSGDVERDPGHRLADVAGADLREP